MQSHIRLDENKKLKKGESVIRVRSLTVKTLAKTFHIPHRFGILSIDAEGVGDKVRIMPWCLKCLTSACKESVVFPFKLA